MASTNNNSQLVTLQVAQTLRSEDMQKQMATLLPPGVKLDRFTEVTIAAIENSPEVLQADRDSLYRACVAAARRGLLPDKKEGALVIYNTNVGTRDQPRWMKMVQFMPMVEGIIKEMAKADICAYAVAVYEEDSISFWNDDEGQHVRHEPQIFGDRGQIVGFFSAAKTKDGRPYVEAMSLKDVEQVARRSKQCYVEEKTGVLKYGGTWKTDFDRMGQKSCLHRLRKRLPILEEDALQNLKDMEETTDIDVATATPPSQSASPPEPESSSPPPEKATEQVALPPPLENPLNMLRTPRKSRVLQDIVKNNADAAIRENAVREAPSQPQGTSAPVGGARDKPTSGNLGSHTSQSTPSSGSAAPAVEPEYSEDDII